MVAKVRMKGPGPSELEVEYRKLGAEGEIIRLAFLPSHFGYNLEEKKEGAVEADLSVRMTMTQNTFPDGVLSEGLIEILAMGTRKYAGKDAAQMI